MSERSGEATGGASGRSPIGGAPVFYFDEIDSTMNRARQLVAEGAASGTVVVADHQTAGRGRRSGRVWYSDPGDSLMFTLILHDPPFRSTAPIRAGLAVVRSLERTCRLQASVKWPNDVMVGDRKIAGVLCDLIGTWLHVGVGVNLLQASFPADLEATAISVRLAGAAVPARDELLIDLLRELGHLLIEADAPDDDTLAKMLDPILYGRDEPVVITLPDSTKQTGILRRVDVDGSLLVESDDGSRRVISGEIDVRRP